MWCVATKCLLAAFSAVVKFAQQIFEGVDMPFYEYRCGSCGHELEAMQKMSDSPLTDCPACDRSELVKLVLAAGFRLKGGGWYETDFKGGTKKNVSESTTKESAAGHSCGTGGCSSCS